MDAGKKKNWNKHNSQNKVTGLNSHIYQYSQQIRAVLSGKLAEFKGKSVRL